MMISSFLFAAAEVSFFEDVAVLAFSRRATVVSVPPLFHYSDFQTEQYRRITTSGS